MEPISPTYGSPLTLDSSGTHRVHRQTEAVAGEQTNRGSGQTVPTWLLSAKSDIQPGFRPTGNNGEEFQTYGSRGLPGRKRPDSPPAPGQNESLPTNSGETKKEDPRIEQVIAQLRATEEKVKAHEAAHKSAGGAATGPVSYSYTRGPDGRSYITGGEVPISISTGKTPQETISKMEVIIRAALAPADPSPQDRAVAAQATSIQQSARQEQASSRTGTDRAPGTLNDTADTSAPQAGLPSQRSQRAYGDAAVTGKNSPAERTFPQKPDSSIAFPFTASDPSRYFSAYS